MQILLWTLYVLVVVLFGGLLGLQFYKIGKWLKEKYILIYRFYLIAWILMALIIVSIGLIFFQESINTKKRIEREQELALILKMDDVIEKNGEKLSIKDAVKKTMQGALSQGQTSEDVYIYIKNSQTLSAKIQIARQAGFSDYEIKQAIFYAE